MPTTAASRKPQPGGKSPSADNPSRMFRNRQPPITTGPSHVSLSAPSYSSTATTTQTAIEVDAQRHSSACTSASTANSTPPAKQPTPSQNAVATATRPDG